MLPEFDDKVVSLYARGMTVREIQGHLRELYGIEASPDLVSTVTDAVLEQVAEWQNRPLDAVYALVFFDALRVALELVGKVHHGAEQGCTVVVQQIDQAGLRRSPPVLSAPFVSDCMAKSIRLAFPRAACDGPLV